MSRVREFRERNNEKQFEMARLINTTKGNYSKKESGLLRFSLQEAKIIAEHFGDTIENIFFEPVVSEIEINRRNSPNTA